MFSEIFIIAIVCIFSRFVSSYYFDLDLKDIMLILITIMCTIVCFLKNYVIYSYLGIIALSLQIIINNFFYLNKIELLFFFIFLIVLILIFAIVLK